MRYICTSIVAVLALAAAASAETHTVLANSSSFSPDTLTVAPGDTIVWQYNAGYPHTVTSGTPCSADGVFDAPLNGSNPTFTWDVPADASGTIAYFCEPHCNWGMTATLTVVGPTTIHVPGDYPTIQMAIQYSIPGDTVQIAAGTYMEYDIALGRSINIVGETDADGNPTVIIDADGEGSVFLIDGIMGSNPHPMLQHLELRNGYGLSGGGARIMSASPTFDNCTFHQNTAANEGGGLLAVGNSPVLTNCRFSNNAAPSGGGVYAVNVDTMQVTGCAFCGNDGSPADIGGDWTDLGGNTFADQCGSSCTGDLDGNGEVGVDDLLAVLAAYQQNADGDIDGDGDTDVDDLLLLISAWGACV